MPKITRLGGPSNAGLVKVRARGVLSTVVDPVQPIVKEEPWPGNSSETSPEKQPPSVAPKKRARRKPAPTTASPLTSTAGSGTAPSVTTSGPATDAPDPS